MGTVAPSRQPIMIDVPSKVGTVSVYRVKRVMG